MTLASMDINKLIAKLPTGFVDDCSGWDEERLREEIVTSNANIRENNQTMKEDEKLNGAKEIVKDLSIPYREVKKAQQAKIDYCLHLLEERGQLKTTVDE